MKRSRNILNRNEDSFVGAIADRIMAIIINELITYEAIQEPVNVNQPTSIG